MRILILPFIAVLGSMAPGAATAARIWATHGVVNDRSIVTIDTDNGYLVETIGPYSLDDPAEFTMGGLEFDAAGNLFGISIATPDAQLYAVDTTSGAATSVGPLLAGHIFEGALALDTTTGLLWGGYNDSHEIFTIDTTTGKATIVGKVGAVTTIVSLMFDTTGQLYALTGNYDGGIGETTILWRVDKNNPNGPGTTIVGYAGSLVSNLGGMAQDPETGIVYAYAWESRELFTIDLATAETDIVHQFDETVIGFPAFAIAPSDASAVESTTWGAIKEQFTR